MPEVLILSKTQMNNGHCCVGGITMGGQYIRLLDENGENQPEDCDFEPREIWEIEFNEREDVTPPHVEDVLVTFTEFLGELDADTTVLEFIEARNIPVWRGSPDELFDGLVQWTDSGSGYIDEENSIPGHSVGFWVSDRDLLRQNFKDVIKYRYPYPHGWRSIKFKGYGDPVDRIPRGTLIRVSLARWYARTEDETEKCWLQLSGWYDI